MRCRGRYYPVAFALIVAATLWLSPRDVMAQGTPKGATPQDSLTAQTIRSRRGYLIRIPVSASLDSARSGWSPQEKFEVRVYTMPGVGEIRLRVEIGKMPIPEDAVEEGAYRVIDHDSATSVGTIHRRTWYLEHRRVEITLVPYGIAMVSISDRRKEIYQMFRWSDGADSEKTDVGDPGMMPAKQTHSARLGG